MMAMTNAAIMKAAMKGALMMAIKEGSMVKVASRGAPLLHLLLEGEVEAAKMKEAIIKGGWAAAIK